MPTKLFQLQFECDRAARDFLALAAWGFNRESVRDAVSRLTTGVRQPPSALAWLVEHVAKLPSTDEPARRLHELVQADAALRAYRTRHEIERELLNCVLVSELRCA